MARRIFMSFCYADQMKAKGFNLLRWNKNVSFNFVGRHLLDPVDSTNKDYIARKIREQISGTSVTVVLLGAETCDSEWVNKEIEWSLAKDCPNGIVAIKLQDDAPVPDILHKCGAEIVGWQPHEFQNAIERAAIVARRPAGTSSAGAEGDCAR